MSSTLGSLCNKISYLLNCFEDVALNVDTNTNQNLEPLLRIADSQFGLGTHDVPLRTCVRIHHQFTSFPN